MRLVFNYLLGDKVAMANIPAENVRFLRGARDTWVMDVHVRGIDRYLVADTKSMKFVPESTGIHYSPVEPKDHADSPLLPVDEPPEALPLQNLSKAELAKIFRKGRAPTAPKK